MQHPPPSRRVIKFGVFEADLVARELRRNGLKVRLQEQPFQVLVALLENPGCIVAREELRRKLWPADTFVDFDSGLNTAINKIREVLGDSAETPRYVETIPRRGYRFLETVPAARSSNVIDSIAVLPFINTSADPDVHYLATGIPGGIIQRLSQIPSLKVIASCTVSGYKDGGFPAPGADSEAGAVLLGRIWQRGNRLRLQVDLVSTLTGEELWGEQYDVNVTELFAVQDEISHEVSSKLRIKLTGEQASRLSRRYTENIEAYQLYLRGRANSEKRTAQSFKKGYEYLNEAIRLDPKFALAYAELSQCVHMPAYYGTVSPHEAYPKARVLALKALSMDNSLAEAHDTLAMVLQNYDYDWVNAEKEYKCALQLNPNCSVARLHYAMFLSSLGRFEEAENESREGQARDPLSGIMNAGFPFIFACARQYERCIEQSLTALDIDPAVSFTYISLGLAYEMTGRYDEAIAAFEKSLALGGSAAVHLAQIGHVYGKSGRSNLAWEMVERLKKLAGERYIPQWSLAMVYDGLREKELGLQCLEAALPGREALLFVIKVWPQLDNLRDDPRYHAIEHQVGLCSDPHDGPGNDGSLAGRQNVAPGESTQYRKVRY